MQRVREAVGANVRIYIFVFRLDDQARGGDVDLLVEADEHVPVLVQARLQLQLERELDLPVDLLVAKKGDDAHLPFVCLAKLQGKELA